MKEMGFVEPQTKAWVAAFPNAYVDGRRERLRVALRGEGGEDRRQTGNQNVVDGEAGGFEALDGGDGSVHRAIDDVARRSGRHARSVVQGVSLVTRSEENVGEGAKPLAGELTGRHLLRLLLLGVLGFLRTTGVLEEKTHNVHAVQNRVMIAQKETGLARFRLDDVRKHVKLPENMGSVERLLREDQMHELTLICFSANSHTCSVVTGSLWIKK